MNNRFIDAFRSIQELFQELAAEGKITPEQAAQFDQAQKEIVNYHSWIQGQLEGKTRIELPWKEQAFTEAWKLWTDYKKQQFNYTYKAIGEQGALKDLADLSGGDMSKAIAVIHQSIKKGWKGFFPLQEGNSQSKPAASRQTDYKQNLISRLGGI